MRVVLDSTALHGDFGLVRPKLVTLLTSPNSGVGWRVAVPQVVVDEQVNQYREELTKAGAAFESVWRHSPPMAIRAEQFAFDADAAAQAFRTEYTAKLVKEGAVILPYPKIAHADLVARDLKRKKPFDVNGKGYRDALIWESLLEWVAVDRDGADVVLVTKNSNDFGATLAPDLVEDVKARGLRDGLVKVVRSPEVLVDGTLSPALAAQQEQQQLVGFATALKAGMHPSLNLSSWIEKEAVSAFWKIRLNAAEAEIASGEELIGTRLGAVHRAGGIAHCLVRKLPDGKFVVEATVMVDAMFIVERVYDDEEDGPMGILYEPEIYEEQVDAWVELDVSLLLNEQWGVLGSSLDSVREAPRGNPHD